MSTIYLSICIPTNGRIEILKKTIDSIYSGCSVDLSEFEVVISDNSDDDQLLKLLDQYKNYTNIIYKKSKASGFLNSISALSSGSGCLLKLHNNYSMLKHGEINNLILTAKKYHGSEPLIYFTNGVLKISNDKEFSSFDEFCYKLSYWTSASSCFSIWKSDFNNLDKKNLNKYFPQTSLLILQNYKKSFVICDYVYSINQYVPNKGGYNLFEVFAVDYLNILKSSVFERIISQKTFNKIKSDLLNIFLVRMYYNNVLTDGGHKFEVNNIYESIVFYYGKLGYFRLISLARIFLLKKLTTKFIKTIINKLLKYK